MSRSVEKPVPSLARPASPVPQGRRLKVVVLLLAVVAAGAVFAWPLVRRALERSPDDLEVIRKLARGYHDADQLAEAESYLTRWCNLRPDEAEPYKLRMEARHKLAIRAPSEAETQRLQQEALADGQRALQLDPENDPVAQEVVWLSLSTGRFEEAERECRRCLKRQPNHPWLLFLLAKALYGQGANAEAEKILDPLVRDQPRFPDALLLRAILYRQANQPDRAIPLLRQVLALGRQHQQETLYHLSLALASTGQTEEAKRVMAERQALGLEKNLADPDFRANPAFRVWAAEIWLGAGKSEEALRLLDQVLQEDPDFAPAHRLLAIHYEKQGQVDQAAEHRRRAGK
jgi:tetratricopeptide (TPR) repeat protein